MIELTLGTKYPKGVGLVELGLSHHRSWGLIPMNIMSMHKSKGEGPHLSVSCRPIQVQTTRGCTRHMVRGFSTDVLMEEGKWEKTALLVIDMQNDFILPGGPMHVTGGAPIVSSVRKAVEIGRKRGALIVWVVREHDPFGRDVELFRRHLYGDRKEMPVIKGSKGAELVDALAIEGGDYKLVKTRFSAFFATPLDGLLKSNGVTDLVVVGVQTPNCIRQTVFDAVALDYKSVTVIVDATAAATPEVHAANISDMKNIGVATPTLLEWCRVET